MRAKISICLFLGLILSLTCVTLVKGETPQTLAAQNFLKITTLDSFEPTLNFDWGEKSPALGIVKTSNNQATVASGVVKWWVVFDENATTLLPENMDSSHAISTSGIKGIEIIPSDANVILQIITDSSLSPVVVKEGNQWHITFKNQALSVVQKAPVRLPQSKGEEFVVGLAAPGKEVRFADPETGEEILIFPTHRIGFGSEEGQVFPEFRTLIMAQGVGFQINKTDLNVSSTPNQVILKHPEGLAISSLQTRNQARKIPLTPEFFAEAQDLDWVDRLQRINEGLLDLNHDQHAPGELEIAWLLLGHGQAGEALGYLTHLAQERPSIAHLPLFQILRGMGNLLLNRLPESEKYLWPYQDEPEVHLWLSLMNALQQPHYYTSDPQAFAHLRAQFQAAKATVKTYPKPLRTQMVTLILMAGIALRDLETLISFLDQEARPDNLNAAQVYDLARARVLMDQGKEDAALQILGELMEKAVSPHVRAIASFDYIAHRLVTKDMNEKEALPQLESLRIQWHGKWLDRQIGVFLLSWKDKKHS
jgi:hypothetical protein